MTPTIGFIGTGIMGKPMAKNLLDAGYDVVAHNRSPEPVADLVDAGAEAGDSPADTARASDIVISCLPETEHVERVALGEDGIIEGVSEGMIYADMSTISPMATEALAEEFAEHGVQMLDAPISGGEEGAIEAELSIMVGGDEDAFEEVYDVFDAMGSTITHCGDSGSGQVAKACNQIVVGCTHQAVSEALMLAECAGADLQAVLDAITPGAANCWSLEARAPRVIRGNFEAGFFSSYQYKDLRIATDAGEEYGAPMPSTSVVHEMYKAMENTGRGEDDHSAVIQILEDMADEEARIEEAD